VCVGPASKRQKQNGTAPKAPHVPTHIVLDIEGTVAPITFVSDKLFPYAKQHVAEFLQESFDLPEVQSAVEQLMAGKVCECCLGHANSAVQSARHSYVADQFE
jgi:methionine salvage enolase-phosphatase E1